MTKSQVEVTLHDVFDHMHLNKHLVKIARKAAKNFVMRKGFSLSVADQITDSIFH